MNHFETKHGIGLSAQDYPYLILGSLLFTFLEDYNVN